MKNDILDQLPTGIKLDKAGYSHLTLTPLDAFNEHRRVYRLERDFYYYSERLKKYICVPKGTRTDMASVPRCWLSFVPKDGRLLKASVVHDYMYQRAMFDDKRLADDIFLEGMIKSGVKRWRRLFIFYGARYLGKGAYVKKIKRWW